MKSKKFYSDIWYGVKRSYRVFNKQNSKGGYLIRIDYANGFNMPEYTNTNKLLESSKKSDTIGWWHELLYDAAIETINEIRELNNEI